MDHQNLPEMSREQLREELERARLDLEENEELRTAFLGTGVHVGVPVRQHALRKFDLYESRLKERICLIEKFLSSRNDGQEQNV